MVTFENGDLVPSQGRGRFLKIVYSTTTDHSISSITKHVLPRDYNLHMPVFFSKKIVMDLKKVSWL